jgi:Zn-dependent peptidase ImmA (M78 family)
MKIISNVSSKKRLFEIMQRVNGIKLNEETLQNETKEKIIAELVKFAADKLGFSDDLPKIIVSYDEKEAENMKSFGKYTPYNDEIRVVVAKRNLADALRTLAHELVHHKQNKNGILTQESNESGSNEENEANAVAGVIMREFGQKHPEIFE